MLGSLSELLQTETGLMVAVLGISALAVGWLYYPHFRFQIAKFLGRHQDEIASLYENNLTPLMRSKLDEAAEKYVKDEILGQIILSAYDHTAEEVRKEVKKHIRELAKETR